MEGVSLDTARSVVQDRLTNGRFTGVEDLYGRVTLSREALEALVKAGALDTLDRRRNRREAYFVLQTVAHARPPGTRALLTPAAAPDLPDLSADVQAELDVRLTGTTRPDGIRWTRTGRACGTWAANLWPTSGTGRTRGWPG